MLSRCELTSLANISGTRLAVFCSKESGIRENELGQLIRYLNLHSLTQKKIASVLTLFLDLDLDSEYSDPVEVWML